ncbi:MAG TPA: nucleotidyltransferase family protein, partial [Thermoanaerobaculia bacterium]|nr:nucleotidyltransferase family protein [Thermoanaerobaculia bacterium]
MADFIHVRELPEPIRGPLRALLCGGSAEWPRQYDRDAFAAACEEHAIAPLVYARLPLPELREQATRAAATEPLRLADLRRVLAAFAEAGVEALILKGTALAYDLYPSPELRPRSDVDLLVTDFARAAGVLRALGFEAYANSGDELALRQQSFGRSDAFELLHLYDLHRQIANPASF